MTLEGPIVRKPLLSYLLATGLACAALPLAAGEVEKNVNFALEEWIELNATDGPVTLHRIRIAKQSGITKSKFLRPGNSEYLQDVQIQLEFSNDTSRDWEARMEVEWLDGAGQPIDGYNDSETLGEDSRRDEQTVTLSTLKYGLDKAKKLRIAIRFEPD